jgi:hypothetical protein
MIEISILEACAVIGTLIGVAGLGARLGIIYTKAKGVLKIAGLIASFIDSVDDAIYDDNISEEEFRKIWENGKLLIEALR